MLCIRICTAIDWLPAMISIITHNSQANGLFWWPSWLFLRKNHVVLFRDMFTKIQDFISVVRLKNGHSSSWTHCPQSVIVNPGLICPWIPLNCPELFECIITMHIRISTKNCWCVCWYAQQWFDLVAVHTNIHGNKCYFPWVCPYTNYWRVYWYTRQLNQMVAMYTYMHGNNQTLLPHLKSCS